MTVFRDSLNTFGSPFPLLFYFSAGIEPGRFSLSANLLPQAIEAGSLQRIPKADLP